MKAPTIRAGDRYHVKGFHSHDGWFFLRQEDGSVRIFHVEHPHLFTEVPDTDADLTLPPGVWASVMASMSSAGETAQTYGEALAFHDRDARAVDALSGAIFLAHSAGLDDEAVAAVIRRALPGGDTQCESEGC